jgi:hypothetical protein
VSSQRAGSSGCRRRSALAAVLLAAWACAALAACGGTSGGAASASASPSPAPVPTPKITSGAPPAAAVDVVRAFWTLLGEGKLAEAKATLVAPGSPILRWDEDSIASARFVRVVPGSVGREPLEGATIEFSVEVWIEQAASAPNVWGDPREHQLFEHVVRMSDGTWRMWDSGTGP